MIFILCQSRIAIERCWKSRPFALWFQKFQSGSFVFILYYCPRDETETSANYVCEVLRCLLFCFLHSAFYCGVSLRGVFDSLSFRCRLSIVSMSLACVRPHQAGAMFQLFCSYLVIYQVLLCSR